MVATTSGLQQSIRMRVIQALTTADLIVNTENKDRLMDEEDGRDGGDGWW